jgi:protein-S-isoprenylcysteine O-methyltransferase Ste14
MNVGIFRFILPIIIVAFVAHRGYYIKKHTRPDDETVKEREEGTASKIAGLLAVLALVATITFVINPNWLSWAEFPFAVWVRWVGVVITLLGFALLQWAQITLGKSWSDTPRMMNAQTLVTGGPYRLIRHPIYTAFLLILGSTLLISANWLIGLGWTGMTLLEISSRIHFEEKLLIDFFGDQYRNYIKYTGRIFPKLF